jgi:hypothetical protein
MKGTKGRSMAFLFTRGLVLLRDTDRLEITFKNEWTPWDMGQCSELGSKQRSDAGILIIALNQTSCYFFIIRASSLRHSG